MCSGLHCCLPLFIMIRESYNLQSDIAKEQKENIKFSKRKHFQLQNTKCKSIASYIFQDKNLEICCQVLMSLCYPQQSVAKRCEFFFIVILNVLIIFFLHLANKPHMLFFLFPSTWSLSKYYS